MLKKDFIMSLFNSSAIRLCIVSAFCLTAHSVFAEGMVPETSLLVIDEAKTRMRILHYCIPLLSIYQMKVKI